MPKSHRNSELSPDQSALANADGAMIKERNADVCRADQLLLFMIFFVFLELCLFVAKQFLEHPAPLKIGRVFDHCPIVFNVLSSDKTFHNNLRRSAARPRQP